MSAPFQKPRHVQLVRSAKGRVYSYYAREVKGRRLLWAIAGEIGSPGWWRRYRALAEQFTSQSRAA